MVDLKFFLKILALTLVLILFMQLQVGDQTIESEAMLFVHSSAVVSPLRAAAHGAAKMVHDLSREISQAIHSNVKKSHRNKDNGESQSSRGRSDGSADVGQD